MNKEVEAAINKFEDYIGFPLKREDITFESKKTHDETFSYNLCQRFFRKDDELKKGIKAGKKTLNELLRAGSKGKEIEFVYSVLGNMCYVLGNYEKSTAYFIKALNYNRNSVTNWIELTFSLKALGQTEIFETLIFNLQKVYETARKESDEIIDQNYLQSLINKFK